MEAKSGDNLNKQYFFLYIINVYIPWELIQD